MSFSWILRNSVVFSFSLLGCCHCFAAGAGGFDSCQVFRWDATFLGFKNLYILEIFNSSAAVMLRTV